MSASRSAMIGGMIGGTTEHNWGGNLEYSAGRIVRPATVEELRTAVRAAPRVKALGTRHAFSGVADTTGDLVSLERLDRVVALDADARTVTIEGGVRYGPLGRFLHARGFALHNLASLPHLSVAGAVATGTHGSGDRSPGLASAVVALDLVTADGEIVSCSRDRDAERWDGLVVSLGALGIAGRLTLAVEPTYEVAQAVYEGLPLAAVAEDLDAVTGAADGVSLFTSWRGDVFHQAWLKRRVREGAPPFPADWRGAALADGPRHPIPGLDASNCTEQGGAPGPWFERWPHFREDGTPSRGDEVQSEYFVAREVALDAMRALFAVGERLAPALLVSEVRTIAAGTAWLDPAHGRDSVGFHFTWRRDAALVRAAVTELEAALAPFEARPHWGKVFALPPARVAALSPRLADFAALRAALDPGGRFGNAFLDALVPVAFA